MAFQQGLSGLNLSSKALDAVGNNIANSQTVGFKASAAQFADVYAAAVGGAVSGNLVGQGGSVADVSQNFTQGNVSATNNPLDIAINGSGFLRFQPTLTDKTQLYTRNGQLHLDSDGYLVNAQNQYLNAYLSTDGEKINEGEPVPLQLTSSLLQPRATGFDNSLASGTGGVEIGLNFDVRDKRTATAGATANSAWTGLQAWDVASAADFSNLNPNMYNYSTSSTVYDQRGEPHIMTMYFVRQGIDDGTGVGTVVGGSSWQPYFVLDSKYVFPTVTNDATDGSGGTTPRTLDFSPNGQLTETANGSFYTIDVTQAMDKDGNTIDLTSAAGNSLFPQTVDANASNYLKGWALTVDFGSTTQFGSNYDVSSLNQDGFGPGRLSGVAIDSDGKVQARYSNGQTKLMGQVVLSTFQNPNGLIPLGNNMWAESAASGQPLPGAPLSGSRGSIQAGSVEEANVDLTQELVNMITLQRAYQANAQTIRTQDEILQTLVNLR